MDIILIIVIILILALYSLIMFYEKKHKGLLQKYPTYSSKYQNEYPTVRFHYASADDENLKKLRELYQLDSIAGQGSEAERIISLMKWVYQLTSHASNPTIPQELNALNLIDLCMSENKKLNCMMYAIILNEVYLSMGFPSRVIHLLPHDGEHRESHWVNAVYSFDLGKWIMMDPDMCGYLRDERGQILGISEIRQRIVDDEPLIVNEDIGGLPKIFGKWSYTRYLSKNIFRYNCLQNSVFGKHTQRENLVYYELLPDGFREALLSEPKVTPRGNKIVYISDCSLFWQRPGLS